MKRPGSLNLRVSDVLAIEQLNARFALAFDKILPDAAIAWAGSFTRNGTFTLLDSNGNVQREARGTEELIALHGELSNAAIRHWYCNMLMERERGGAVSMRCYLISLDTAKRAIARTATYRDTIVMQRGRWKFRSRTATLDAGSS